jgi:[calcium/calmodulin-dependent protein kinase] kinase
MSDPKVKSFVEFTSLEKKKDSEGRKSYNGFLVVRKDVGKGAFSSVHHARKDGREFALKKISKSSLKKRKVFGRNAEGMPVMSTALAQCYSEIALMKTLRHENVIQLHATIDDEDDDALFLVLEYCPGGTVLAWDPHECRFSWRGQGEGEEGSEEGKETGSMPESEAKRVFKGLLAAVTYLHGARVAHRDIKPDNVLLGAGGAVKLVDFGVSKQFAEGESGEVSDSRGTPEFYSPEACSGEPYDAYKTDIWSMGVTLFCMGTGRMPWLPDNAMDQVAVFDLIEDANLTVPAHLYSQEWEQLVRSILNKNVEERLSLSQIAQHPWLA